MTILDAHDSGGRRRAIARTDRVTAPVIFVAATGLPGEAPVVTPRSVGDRDHGRLSVTRTLPEPGRPLTSRRAT